nr:DNA polymerase III subunit beta [Desulfobacterales bacterium]
MDFKIKTEDILKGMTNVQGITSRKTNLPVTSNVSIDAQNSQIRISATDLEVGYIGYYPAEVDEEGSTLISSKKFFEILKEFPSENIHFLMDEKNWILIRDIKNRDIEYHIAGTSTEEFPTIPGIDDVSFFEIGSSIIKQMIEKTIYIVLNEEIRSHLTGVYFEKKGREDKVFLRMVSTDGNRLSLVDQPIDREDDLIFDGGVIIPKRGLSEVLKVLKEDTRAKIGIKGNNFILSIENETFIIRLIEAEFPEYDRVIPMDNKKELKIEKDAFKSMLRRMSILSSDKYRGVKFKIDKDRLEAVTINPEIGESRESIKVSYNDEPFEIGFNPKFIIDTLNVMKSSEITIKFEDVSDPCLFLGKDDPDFISVIMPMRIK